MRRAIVGALLVILALALFYVAWPAWTVRGIAMAVEADDPAALERRIDFPRVRERIKPVITAEVERSVEQLQKQSGPLGAAIAGQLKGGLSGKLAETAVESLMTPSSVIQMIRQGTDFRRAIRRASERVRGSPQGGSGTDGNGGNGGPGEAGKGAPPPGPRKLGLGNIKRYALTGPLSLAVDVARHAESKEPDMTLELAFTGGTWKVVGLLPRL